MTREQKWAKAAYDAVMVAKQGDEKAAKEFGSLCKNGPGILQRAGAAQALGFWNRNAKDKTYLDALARVWGSTRGGDLLALTLKAELKPYMVLTRELMSAAIWLRRFAQAEIADE